MKFLASASQLIRTSAIVRIALGFLIAAGLLLLIGWLVTGPARPYAASFDGSIRSSIRQMQSPLWTSLFLPLTKFGSTIYLIIAGSTVGIAGTTGSGMTTSPTFMSANWLTTMAREVL